MVLQSIETRFYLIDAFRQLNDTTDAGKGSFRLLRTIFYFKDVLIYLVESCNASQLVNSLYYRLRLCHYYEFTFSLSKSKYIRRVFSGRRPTPIPMVGE